jgi:hypothetical protein
MAAEINDGVERRTRDSSERAPDILQSPEGTPSYLQGSIQIGPDSVNLYASEDIWQDKPRPNDDYNIPGYEFSDAGLVAPIKLFCSIDTANPGIDWYPDRDEAVLRADRATLESGATIAFLAQNLTERLRQEREQFTLQGNAVITPRGEAIVILGERGSGKTSITVELCQGFDCQFYANGQLVLGRSGGEARVSSGSQKLYVRRNQLADQTNRYVELSESAVSVFDQKVIIPHEDLGISAAKGEFKIAGLVVVHLDATGQAETAAIKKEPTNLMDNLFLAEKLQRQITGVSTPLIDAGGKLVALSPSFATDETRRNCVNFINSLYEEVQIYEVSGSNVTQMSRAISAIAEGRR